MMSSDPAIIEAVEAALDLNVEEVSTWEIQRAALAVLAAVTPLIRAAALEEAAKVAEEWETFDVDSYITPDGCADIADAIRKLKEQP